MFGSVVLRGLQKQLFFKTAIFYAFLSAIELRVIVIKKKENKLIAEVLFVMLFLPTCFGSR
jgi:hypothetical protein